MNIPKFLIFCLIGLTVLSCNRKVMKATESSAATADVKLAKPIDALATKETKALYKNLLLLSSDHTLFGHQHATEYGHGWAGEER